MDEKYRNDESDTPEEMIPGPDDAEAETAAGPDDAESEITAGPDEAEAETAAGPDDAEVEITAGPDVTMDEIMEETSGHDKEKKRDNALVKGIVIGMIFVMIPLLVVLGGTALYLRAHNYYIGIGSRDTADFTSKIAMIQKIIDEYYLFDYDEEELDDSAISSYVDSLGDPYTVYYDAEDYKKLQESNSGSYKGIGVQIGKSQTTGEIYIEEVFDDSPAKKAGIEAEDQLIRVGDTDVTDMELSDVVSMIKNAETDSVNLTVKRDGEEISMDVELQTITVNTVASKMLDDEIGYLYLSQFEECSTEQFREAVDNLKEQGMKKLIVDLRENPGGLLNTAVDIADIFVDTGVVVTVKDKNDNVKEYTADEKGSLGIPVVVLVNGDSASASEVLSGCLKDYGLATLVGTTTFGKGIVQQVLPFGDGTGIKITTAHYYTPDGNDIHGVGITPDVTVEDDPDTEEDEQMEKALEVIKDMN